MAKYIVTNLANQNKSSSATQGYLQDEEDANAINPSNIIDDTPKRGIPIEKFSNDDSSLSREGVDLSYDDETFNLVSNLADEITARKQQPASQERFANPADVDAVEYLGANQDYNLTSNEGLGNLPSAERSLINAKAMQDEAFPSVEQLKTSIGEVGKPNFFNLTDTISNTLTNIKVRDPAINPRFKIGTDPQIVNAAEKLNIYDPNTGAVKDNFTSALSFAVVDQLVNKRIASEEQLQKARSNFEENKDGKSEKELNDSYQALEASLNRANEMGINTQQDADAILRTAEKALKGPTANREPSLVDTLNGFEKSALLDAVFFDLTDQQFLKKGSVTDADGNTKDSRTWVLDKGISDVMKSIPDVIDTLQGNLRKTPSNSPNPGGRTATDAGYKYKPTGKSNANLGLRWMSRVEEALDYYGTTAMMISTPTLNAEFNLLQDIINYNDGSEFNPLSPNGTTLNNTLFSHAIPNKSLTVAVSNHPSASFFKMDVNSLRSALNSSHPKNFDRDYLKNTEEMLEAIKAWSSGFEQDPMVDKWIIAAVDKFNQGVGDYLNPLFEANINKGKPFFYHQELIGVNGRMRIADTSLNPQSDPAYRGIVTSTKVIIVDPDSSSERTQNFKGQVARNLNLTMRVRDKNGNYVINKKGGVDPAEVKAEHLPRLKQRVELFDLYFGKNPIKPSDPNADYKNAKRLEGQSILNAANSLSGIGTAQTINSAIDPLVSQGLNSDFEAVLSIDRTRGVKVSDRWVKGLGFSTDGKPSANGPKLKFVNGPNISSDFDRVNIAKALGAMSKDGDIINGHKEGSMHMATLVNLARFDQGHKFRSDLVSELDGINNNFAILGLLLGDADLVSRSGILNPNIEDTGQIVSDGDMRDYVHKQAREFLNEITEDFLNTNPKLAKDSENINQIADIVLSSIETESTGAVKLAWKDIIMQAGYGKDFNAFPSMFVEKLSSDTNFLDGLEKQLSNNEIDNLTPIEALTQVSQIVPKILGKALGSLNDYTNLTKTTGVLASILKQQYTVVSSSGFPVNMSATSKAPKIKGHVDDRIVLPTLRPIATDTGKALIKEFEVDPFQIKRPDGQRFTQEGAATLLNDIQKEYIEYLNPPSGFSKKDTPKMFWKFLSTAAFAQRNRAPVLPIHAEDAATMVTTARYAANMNKKIKNPQDKLWFYQIFDALMVDTDSFTSIPREYNRALVEQVLTMDRYGQDLLELNRFKRNAIADGDIEVAAILEKITSGTRLIPGLKQHIQSVRERLRVTRNKLSDELNHLNLSIEGPGRYKDYKEFVKKRDGLIDRMENLHKEPSFKIKESDMSKLFANFSQFNQHVSRVKSARKDVNRSTKELYEKLVAQAKEMGTNEGYSPFSIGGGTHNAS